MPDIALVTGSGRGIGRAIAEALASSGAHIVVHDISEEAPSVYGEARSLSSVAAELSKNGSRTMAVTGDISDEAIVREMVSRIEAELGPVSVLVNCAGGDIGARGTKPNPNNALEVSMADVDSILRRNLIGTMVMCQAICPGMIERGLGSIVNIASIAAHSGGSPEVAYACAKAAVVHYSRCLAFELRPKGVRVNVVSPGPTRTARLLATRATDPEMLEEGTSLNRYATPAEIASTVAFLASDQSRFVNGQVIRVDGGAGLYPA